MLHIDVDLSACYTDSFYKCIWKKKSYPLKGYSRIFDIEPHFCLLRSCSYWQRPCSARLRQDGVRDSLAVNANASASQWTQQSPQPNSNETIHSVKHSTVWNNPQCETLHSVKHSTVHPKQVEYDDSLLRRIWAFVKLFSVIYCYDPWNETMSPTDAQDCFLYLIPRSRIQRDDLRHRENYENIHSKHFTNVFPRYTWNKF